MRFSMVAIFIALCPTGSSFAEVPAGIENPAEELLRRNGVEPEGHYVVIRHVPYEGGGGMILVHQVHSGLVVFDSEAAFHYTKKGELLRAADGTPKLLGIVRNVDNVTFDPGRVIDEADAIEIFRDSARFVSIPDITGRSQTRVKGPECAQDPEVIDAELGIYRETVVWRVACREQGTPLLYLDASNGRRLSFDAGYRSGR